MLTIPICQRLASQAYVDLGLLFFTTFSIIYLLYWKHSYFIVKPYFYLSAIAAGLALGTKYNGILIIATLSFLCLVMHGLYTQKYTKSVLYSSGFVVIALTCASPWLIRNYLVSGGNPFFPLFTSLFPDTIEEVKPLYTVLNHTILYRLLEGESLTDLWLLPFRIFFDGEDNNFLRFDGKLNPMMLILVPFAFQYPKTSTSRPAGKIISDQLVLFIFTAFIILISLSSRDIRIRYLIPVIAPLIILNTLSINYFLSQRKRLFSYISYALISIYVSYNVLYGYDLLNRLDHLPYLLAKETKLDYIGRKVHLYPIYEHINTYTDNHAVIYDVMSGHRSYYVDREYIHHPRHVDTIFMNYLIQKKDFKAYETYLRELKTRHGTGATHLLIRPYLFLDAYKRIIPGYDRNAILNFIEFLNRQTLLLQSGDTRLYELVFRQAEQAVMQGAGG